MKILIAVDGSDFSRNAVIKCCEIVDIEKVETIKIISVFENPALFVNADAFPVSAQYVTEINCAAEMQALDFISNAGQIVKGYFPAAGFAIINVAVTGIPEKEIIEAARDWKADLIVLGSHGRGFWGRAMIGSVSDAVIHNACCPVLVVREDHNKTGNQKVK